MRADEIKSGIFRGFRGQRGSGIAHVYVEEPEGLVGYPCENGPTARAIIAMDLKPGDAVCYTLGEYGLLATIGRPEDYDEVE